MRDTRSEQRDQHHLRHDDLRHDDDVASVVRHEEQLFVDTRPVETGRVRVSKRVVTEQRTITVRREELVVEELPADHSDARDTHATRDAGVAGNPAKAAALQATEAHRPTAQPGHLEGERPVMEIVLHEERVVTEAVPVERVRVFVDRVTREQTVSDDVRKEVVTVEEDRAPGYDRDRGQDYTDARHRRD